MASKSVVSRLQSRIALRRNHLRELNITRNALKAVGTKGEEFWKFRQHIKLMGEDQQLDKRLLDIAYDDEYNRRYWSQVSDAYWMGD